MKNGITHSGKKLYEVNSPHSLHIQQRSSDVSGSKLTLSSNYTIYFQHLSLVTQIYLYELCFVSIEVQRSYQIKVHRSKKSTEIFRSNLIP